MTSTRAERITRGQYELPMTEHALYRFYDRTDALLYVDITMNLPGRLGQHRSSKPWWLTVAHIDVEYFPNRRAALDAEKAAIKTEHPLHNDIHNEYVGLPVDPDDERCGQECDDDCVRHHGDRGNCMQREDLGLYILDQLTDQVGTNWREEAIQAAKADVALPEEDRGERSWEPNEVVLAAMNLTDKVGAAVWEFRYSTYLLLKALPEDLRTKFEEAARRDVYCGGGVVDPLEHDLLPHVLRHLAEYLSPPVDLEVWSGMAEGAPF